MRYGKYLIMTILLCVSVVFAELPKSVTIIPPHQKGDLEGHYWGLLIRMALEQGGFTGEVVEGEGYELARAPSYVQMNMLDIYWGREGDAQHQGHSQVISIDVSPLVASAQYPMIIKGRTERFSTVGSWADLQKIAVGAVGRSQLGRVLTEKELPMVAIGRANQLFEGLKNKRYEYYLLPVKAIRAELKRYKKSGLQLEPRLLVAVPSRMRLMVARRQPELFTVLEKGVIVVRAERIDVAIAKKVFARDYQMLNLDARIKLTP